MAGGLAMVSTGLYKSVSLGLSTSSFAPSTQSKRPVKSLRFPVTRPRNAALLVSTRKVRQDPVAKPLSQIEAPLSLSFKSLEIQEDRETKQVGEGPRSKDRSAWEILKDPESKQDASSKLPWMDPSLQYANVMWFKGAYNAHIFVSPNESEESIVRRFRHAVSEAGVLRECYRRRYRETPQDVIKRKRKQAAWNRRRKPRYDKDSDNRWKLQNELSANSKKSGNSKKRKDSRSRSGWEARGKGVTDKAVDDIDDEDFWGYKDDEDEKRQ